MNLWCAALALGMAGCAAWGQDAEDHLANAQAHISCALAHTRKIDAILDCKTSSCLDKLRHTPLKECEESDAIEARAQIGQAHFVGNGQTETKPLKCGKYQHYEGARLEDCPDGIASCRINQAAGCKPDMHSVTEKEWQEILSRLKALEHPAITGARVDNHCVDKNGKPIYCVIW